MRRLISQILRWLLFPFWIKFEKIHPYAKAPTRSTEYAAGYDVYAVEPVTIQPGEQKAIPIGLKMQFAPGWGCIVMDRSGLGFKGIAKHCGLIDADYPKEWMIVLRNHSQTAIQFEPSDRVAQLVFVPIGMAEPIAGVISEITNRTGGFGSTGK